MENRLKIKWTLLFIIGFSYSCTLISQDVLKWDFEEPQDLKIELNKEYIIEVDNFPEKVDLTCLEDRFEVDGENDTIFIKNKKLIVNDESCDLSNLESENIQLIDVTNSIVTQMDFVELNRGGDQGDNEETLIKWPIEQIPFYDATLLASGKHVDSILSKYDLVKDSLKLNNFLNIPSLTSSVASLESSNKNEGIPTGLLDNIGGINVTKYVDGLAKFLVQRTKEELTIAFFEEFKNKLNEEPDLNALFPGTANTLMLIDQEIYKIERYIGMLREQFEADLIDLPKNFPALIDNHPLYFDNHPFVKGVVLASSDYVREIKNGIHPGKALLNIDTLRFANNTPGMVESLKIVQLFSEGLRQSKNENDQYWVGYNEMEKLQSNSKLFRIFIGLIAQQAKQKKLTINNKSLFDAMNTASNVSDDFKDLIKSFAKQTNLLNDLIKRDKSSGDKLTPQSIVEYLNASLAIFEQVKGVNKLVKNESDVYIKLLSESKINTALEISRSVTKLSSEIIEKKYGSAIFSVVTLVQQIIESNKDQVVFDDKKQKIAEKSLESLTREYGSVFDVVRLARSRKYEDLRNTYTLSVKSKSNFDNVYSYFQNEWSVAEGQSRLKGLLMKFGGFMSTMVNAQNADDIAAAIETFALPSGSARIKRTSKRNVSLNAYVGPYVGYDFDNAELKNSSVVAGLTAPVGIAYSWGKKGGDKNKSCSIFASLIDIGAVVTYRFADEESDVPDIYLKEIFSPGLFLSSSVGKVLSINGGIQMAPRLRRVSSLSNEISLLYNPRLSLSLVVDIPLMNFATKE